MDVLIAEDEATSARVLCRALEKRGHAVTVAPDGAAAWHLIRERHFPLVISDWLMPGLDGPTLCRNVRAQGREPYTYVILLTARATRDDRVAGLEAGADDFLAKPVDMAELSARLEIARRLLAMQQQVRQMNQHLRRQNVRLTEINAELEQFATIASHDLQEPLRKIQTFSGRLADRHADALGPQGGADLARIQNAAGRMQALIRGLFALSQVAKADSPRVEVNLDQIAWEVVADLEGRLEETQGEVHLGPLATLPGDPMQFRQLLQNLIGNGLKYHRPGEPPVVRVAGESLPGGLYRLTVADNGIGFDEQYLDRIFAPFQRLHGRGEYEGTGIGLTICRKIVERHQGTITARSAPGQGTAFLVTLPATAPDPDTETLS